ncbi:hypothetical protein L0F63_004382 [Massospora cicadina]|nr:hypothetical protein L0F63_004382 [Massospora cicadina]
MPHGSSQDSPLLSPYDSAGSQDNLFNTPTTFTRQDKPNSDEESLVGELGKFAIDTGLARGSQGAVSHCEPLSQASTVSNLGSQEIGHLACFREESVGLGFAVPENSLDALLGEGESDPQVWGALVSLQNGSVYRLREPFDKLVFGRSSSADVQINLPFVSGIHFSLERVESGRSGRFRYYIADNKSTNGTYLIRGGEQLRVTDQGVELHPEEAIYLKFNAQLHATHLKRVALIFVEAGPTLGWEADQLFSLHNLPHRPKGGDYRADIGIHRGTFRKYLIKRPTRCDRAGLLKFYEEHRRCQSYQRFAYHGLPKLVSLVECREPFMVEALGQFGSVASLRYLVQRIPEPRCQRIFRQAYRSLKFLHSKAITHGAFTLGSVYFTNRDDEVMVTGILNLAHNPPRDLVMLGQACFYALGGVKLEAPGPGLASENRRDLDPADVEDLKRALPGVSSEGYDFIAKLLFAREALSDSLHPWIAPKRALGRGEPLPPPPGLRRSTQTPIEAQVAPNGLLEEPVGSQTTSKAKVGSTRGLKRDSQLLHTPAAAPKKR